MALVRVPFQRIGLYREAELPRQLQELESRLERVFLGISAATAVVKLEGKNHVLGPGHRGAYLRISHTAACTLLVPKASVHQFEAGECVSGIQSGTGALTITADSGVTMNNPAGSASLFSQYSPFALTYVGDDEWDFVGYV